MKKRLAAILRFLFSFRGREGNAAYILYYVLLVALGRFYLHVQDKMGYDFAETTAGNAVMAAGSVALLTGAAVLTRRTHDMGLSGLWALALVGLPALLPLDVLPWLYCAIAAFMPGQKDVNRFGPPPRGVKGFILDRRLTALGKAFAKGELSAEDFNARRAALLNPPRPAASAT
jgi:uncharacterized membrane protein YhaH (DUF805 family)